MGFTSIFLCIFVSAKVYPEKGGFCCIKLCK